MGAIGFGPSLALRQRRAGVGFEFFASLPVGATFARASTGTRCDAGGALASDVVDVARFDFDPVTLAPRGVLIEPARTNSATWSQDWTQSVWSRTAIAATATALIEDNATSARRVRTAGANAFAHVAGEPFTISAIASERSGSAKRYLVLAPATVALFGTVPHAVFDLASGTVSGSSAGAVAGIETAPGGWLCWLVATPSGSGSGVIDVRLSNAATALGPTYTGDGTSGLNISHMQIEAGAGATSRIPTSASAVTRAADALTLGWGARGVADGVVTVRYGFDDGSTQDVTTIVSGGTAAVPVTLARARVRQAFLV